jgi:hypothetical protein
MTLVVFLDALDQLGKDDPARSLMWLGGALPTNCRMVLSTTELAPALGECEQREIEPLHETDPAIGPEGFGMGGCGFAGCAA